MFGKFLCEASSPGLLIVRFFLVRFVFFASISSVVICLYKFFDYTWFSFGRFPISRNLSILFRLSNLFTIFSYNPLYFYCGSYYFSSFCLYLGFLFFKMISLVKGLSIFFIISKNQLLVSLIFFIVIIFKNNSC